jgi:uncharacterized membrane protein
MGSPPTRLTSNQPTLVTCTAGNIRVVVIATVHHLPRTRRAAALCAHRYARGEITEGVFTNGADFV